MAKAPARFIEVYSQKVAGKTKILVDMVTGVNYLFHYESDGYGGAGGMDAAAESGRLACCDTAGDVPAALI